jgi:Flp pilus assembly protein TadG
MATMISRLFAAMRLRLKLFALAREGVAAVEFALVLPVMLLLYVGSIELSDLISVDRRVTVMAGTVGDLVARADGVIYESEVTDYFNAAEEIMTPYKIAGLKQLVTSVRISADGSTATVRWSKQSGGATEKTVGTTITLPEEIRNISKNKYVIVSETSYSYTPLMGIVFQNDVDLYRQNFHLPRFGAEIVWTPGSPPPP